MGFLRILSAIMTLIFMSGCSTRHYEWTEDVDLGDGRTIQIEREVTFNFSLPGSGGTAVAEETNAAIRFSGQLRKLPVWQQPLRALELYQDLNDEWVVVATTTSCDVWERRGKPAPPYWEFRLRNHV